MKRIPTTIVILCLVFLAGAFALGTQVSIVVDGQLLALDQPALMTGGRVMVPLRGVFESLSAQVTYDPIHRTILAIRGGTEVKLYLHSRQALVNGQTRMLDVPPLVIGSRVLVPLRFVSEALGAEVRWQAYNRTVNILSRTGGLLTTSPTALPPITTEQGALLPLRVMSPNPAAHVPRVFDVTGTTEPYALVRLRVVAEKSWLGMILGVKQEEIFNGQATADSRGIFHFRIDSGELASGTHLILNMHSENQLGKLSGEIRMELSRQ